MAAASIRVVKEFKYRGVARQYGNRYHFDGGAPPDNTRWTTFSDAIVAAEKAIFTVESSGGAKIVQTVGYVGGSEIPVFTKTYSVDGTGGWTSTYPAPGDCAALVRWSTADRSSKNHPIYCFNYWHGIASTGVAATADQLLATQLSAMSAYAGAWITGFSDGTTTHKRSRPNGNVCTGSLVETLITHRDLPR